MSSGVSVNPECLEAFQELQRARKLKYILFKLSPDNTAIVVEKKQPPSAGSPEKQYEDFLAELPEQECRWAVYDFEFEKGEGEGKRNKICFYSWSPDNAKIKQKMVFASSKDALRRALNGIHVEIQGTDFSEVAYESVLEKASRGK